MQFGNRPKTKRSQKTGIASTSTERLMRGITGITVTLHSIDLGARSRAS
jgi:hypothetical protein